MKPLCRHLVTIHDQKGHLETLFLMQENIKRNKCKYFKSMSMCGLLLGVESTNCGVLASKRLSMCSDFYRQTIFKQRVFLENVVLLASE